MNANGSSGESCTSTPVDAFVPYVPGYQPPTTPPETKTWNGIGYWQATASGIVTSGGNEGSYGDASNIALNAPIVALVATRDFAGYWLVGSDGGVFTFGDAQFFGNPSQLDPRRPAGDSNAVTLGAPIVGMATTPDGKGYWLVASDGGVFTFGDARFFGSASSIVLNKPVVGMAVTPDGKGYCLVASDGGVSAFGDASSLGSLGCLRANDGAHMTFPWPAHRDLPSANQVVD